jgi:hypothetical protein
MRPKFRLLLIPALVLTFVIGFFVVPKSRDPHPRPLDPIAFWPYADTIGGSCWPGLMGGPRFEH